MEECNSLFHSTWCLGQLDLLLEVASRRRDSGVGFSVSCHLAYNIQETKQIPPRPQSSHFIRCVGVCLAPVGSAYPPWELQRKNHANGLDVSPNVMVLATQSNLALSR